MNEDGLRKDLDSIRNLDVVVVACVAILAATAMIYVKEIFDVLDYLIKWVG